MTTQIRPDELIRILKPEFLSIGSGGGVHAGPGIDIVGGVTVGIGYDTILLYDSALAVAAEFAADNAGFAAAIAAAGAGDCIQLPLTLTLTAAHTINGDIILRGPCTITANGDYANLLTLDGGATADNIEINYTTTTGAGGAAIYSSTGCYMRHVNAIITGAVAGPLCGANLIDIDPNSRINDCYCEATGDWGGATRTGLRITAPGGGTRNRLVVEGCIGYAHNNTAAAACYGIYIAGSASVAGEVKFTVVDGCIGYGYAQWSDGVGWGIYAEDCLLDSCIGYGNGGDTIGIHVVNAYAFSCSGHATHEAAGTREAIGILVGGNGEAYSCRAVVTTIGGVFEYGFYCDGADPVVCGGYGHGDTADIYVDAGTTAHIRGVAYDSVAGAGTLSLLTGDRVVMDLDGDTYVTALIMDDEIHIYVNGAEDFRITANTLGVLVGSGIGMADDTWIGLGAGAGSLVFDVTPAPDQIKVSDADLNFITVAHGIIHVDGVAAGEILLADGTRYVPSGWFLSGTAGQTYTFPAVGGTIPTGTGVANRVAYWSGVNTLASDAGLLVDAANDFYLVADTGGIGNSAATARLEFDSGGVSDIACLYGIFKIDGPLQIGTDYTASVGLGVEESMTATGRRYAILARPDINYVGANANPHYGFLGGIRITGAGNLTSASPYGQSGGWFDIRIESGPTVTFAQSLSTRLVFQGAAATATVTAYCGLYVQNPLNAAGGGGTITAAYGVFVKNITFGTTNYSLYVEGGVTYLGGNVGIGTTIFGTNAATVLGIANGTAPTTSPVNMIQIFSVDTSDVTATLGLRTEQAVEAGAPTFSNKLKVLINGTEYWIGLDAV